MNPQTARRRAEAKHTAHACLVAPPIHLVALLALEELHLLALLVQPGQQVTRNVRSDEARVTEGELRGRGRVGVGEHMGKTHHKIARKRSDM